MFQKPSSLEQWMHRRASNLDKATLGQLATLMELTGAESVASINKEHQDQAAYTSVGVNYRQKLARLEQALGVGKLTRRVGKVTRPTEAGLRVAGEVRLFLQELRSIESSKGHLPTWLIGSGDAWIYGVIIPALLGLAGPHPDWRWEVRNLRSRDIRSALREGLIHFGFIRLREVESDLTVGGKLKVCSYRVVLRTSEHHPADAAGMIRWAIESQVPLVQQGSTWSALRNRVQRALHLPPTFSALEPLLSCETYPQALTATETGTSWCIVPDVLGRVLTAGARSALFDAGPDPDDMVLVHYSRSLRKFSNSDKVWAELNRAIRKTF